MDFKKFAQLILIKQTSFALPFAWTGVAFAGGGSIRQWVLVSIALFTARTAGMAFNRVIDANIDARNPRTKERLIPAGKTGTKTVWVIALIASSGLILSSWFLNELVFYLSFAAVILLFTYSYFKRFSSSAHFYLGIVEAAAPIGGYLAINGSFAILPFLLGAGIMFWIAGLDIMYALQDRDFDKNEGLFSIPARYGVSVSLVISKMSYFCAMGSLIAAGLLAGFMHAYWAALLLVGLIFIRQQYLAHNAINKNNTSINKIFSINQYISFIIFLGSLIEIAIPLLHF